MLLHVASIMWAKLCKHHQTISNICTYLPCAHGLVQLLASLCNVSSNIRAAKSSLNRSQRRQRGGWHDLGNKAAVLFWSKTCWWPSRHLLDYSRFRTSVNKALVLSNLNLAIECFGKVLQSGLWRREWKHQKHSWWFQNSCYFSNILCSIFISTAIANRIQCRLINGAIEEICREKMTTHFWVT